MLYLYTIMMLAWDLDKDTHAYFRKYLDTFINKRKISKDLREFVLNTRSRAITSHIRPGRDVKDNFNELRINLDIRIYGGSTGIYEDSWQIKGYKSINWVGAPNLIEKIHPPRYYHNARKLSAPSRPNTNP